MEGELSCACGVLFRPKRKGHVWCLPQCRKKYLDMRLRAANPQAYREAHRLARHKWAEKNREKDRQRRRDYMRRMRAQSPEKQWAKRNPDLARARARAYQAKWKTQHPDKYQARNRSLALKRAISGLPNDPLVIEIATAVHEFRCLMPNHRRRTA